MVSQFKNRKYRLSGNQPNKHYHRRKLQIRKEVMRAFKVVFPVMLSFIPFGMLLGAQAKAHHLSLLELGLMCGLNFAGGSEFVAIGLWKQDPPLLLIVATTALVNCRHILMGAAMIPFCRRFSIKRMMYSFFLMCDECWALSLQDTFRRVKEGYSPAFSYPFYLWVGICLYLNWVGWALLGEMVGGVFGDLTRYGLDMAFTAIFIVILRGMWQGWRRGVPWGISLVIACITYLFIPGEWFVIVGTLAGVVTVLVLPDSFIQKKAGHAE